jgi:hypothetical protein
MSQQKQYWIKWYALVIAFLIVLIVGFYCLTSYFNPF